MIQRTRETFEQLTRARRAVVLAILAFAPAFALRTIGLTTLTPGFSVNEATQGLFARQIGDGSYPIVFGGETVSGEPFFPYALKVVSFVAGEGALEARLVAAVVGSLVVVACGLWLFRAMDSWWWGLAGASLAATSFWQLMFSRQALPGIAVALTTSVGLWCLWEGVHRAALHGRRFSIWYLAAGFAFGASIYTHVSGLIVPILVLMTLLPLGWALQRRSKRFEGGGFGLVVSVMLLTMAPLASFYIDNPAVLQHELDLAGGLPQQLADSRENGAKLAERLVLQGSSNPATNLPGRALLDPIFVLWSIVGLIVVVMRPTRPLHATALIWLLLPIVPIALLDPDEAPLLLPLTPIAMALPLIGMRALMDTVRRYRPGFTSLAVAIILASLIATAGWSFNDYYLRWADDADTYTALRGDLVDALRAADDLPLDDNPLYIMAGDGSRVVRYLEPNRTYRPIETSHVVPMPMDADAYLIAPATTGPTPMLAEFLGEPILSGSDYKIWFLDVRTREELPRGIPVVTFGNAWRLDGYVEQVSESESDGRLSMLVATVWRVPVDADPHTVELRLEPVFGGRAESARQFVQTWKNNPLNEGEAVLVEVAIPFPTGVEPVVDLQVTLRDLANAPVVPQSPRLVIADRIYALLNRLTLEAGEP